MGGWLAAVTLLHSAATFVPPHRGTPTKLDPPCENRSLWTSVTVVYVFIMIESH